MEIIKLKDRIIYRAEKGKKLRFKNDSKKHSEIVLNKETSEIVEVNE